jgi:anti-sigma regulatory factor (Ser/Thr protein kinase)
MKFDCSLTAPAEARLYVRHQLPTGEVADAVELMVSELVTNAVIHAGSGVEMTLEELSDGARVEICDNSERLPESRDPSEAGGRGLLVVEALADRWGVQRFDGGKAIWFEVGGRED